MGQIWIGTTKGLNLFNKKTKKFKNYREKDGLSNDIVFGILEDADQNLWISTNYGISKFNPETSNSRFVRRKSLRACKMVFVVSPQ